MAKIVIYTTNVCPYCLRAKQLLDHKGVRYTEIRVDKDPDKFSEMVTKSAGRRSVPQIFINDKNIGGFDELWVLEQDGQLDQLLSK